MSTHEALTLRNNDEGCDYILYADSVWIEADDIVVYIVNTGDSVSVTLHPTGNEANHTLDSCVAIQTEAAKKRRG